MRTKPTIHLAAALLCATAAGISAQTSILSTFDTGNEGWTQMNLTGDIRYVEPAPPPEPGTCELEPPASGVLSFLDPDAGEWAFEAPAKLLGDQSAMLGGTIRWLQYHQSCEVWSPGDAGPRVVLANTNQAIAIVKNLAPPPQDQWVTNAVKLDDQSGWAWCDETTGQEDLPPATTAQIQQVLQNVTGFRIVGEFITGEDIGCLDDVSFSKRPPSEPFPPIWLTNSAHMGTNFTFSFQTQTNQHYTVEYNDDLRTTNWLFLKALTGDGSLLPCAIPMTNGPQRFFRVRRL